MYVFLTECFKLKKNPTFIASYIHFVQNILTNNIFLLKKKVLIHGMYLYLNTNIYVDLNKVA